MPPVNPKVPLPTSPARSKPTQVHPAVEGLDQFLSHVSHELRTPLSAILLWSRLLDEIGAGDPAQMKEAVGAIKNSAHELEVLIADLVDVSRVLSGSLTLTFGTVALETALDQAVTALRPTADEAQVEIVREPGPAEAHARADAERLGQILRNLLRHAIECSSAGTRVTIGHRISERYVELTISDSGPGLPPQLNSHIFDHFGLGGPPGHPGRGVPLAVVRRLVELHDGRIRAQSGPGPGTTYTIRLPVAGAAPAPPTAMAEPEAELPVKPLQGRRILLVEDAAETRRALSVVLSEAGAVVNSVDSSSAALSAFKRGQVDLVVSDLGLPKMDGYELMLQFRRWERLDAKPPVPAMALTAYAGERTQRRAFESGYQGCLTKPVEPTQLVRALASMVRQRRPEKNALPAAKRRSVVPGAVITK